MFAFGACQVQQISARLKAAQSLGRKCHSTKRGTEADFVEQPKPDVTVGVFRCLSGADSRHGVSVFVHVHGKDEKPLALNLH